MCQIYDRLRYCLIVATTPIIHIIIFHIVIRKYNDKDILEWNFTRPYVYVWRSRFFFIKEKYPMIIKNRLPKYNRYFYFYGYQHWREAIRVHRKQHTWNASSFAWRQFQCKMVDYPIFRGQFKCAPWLTLRRACDRLCINLQLEKEIKRRKKRESFRRRVLLILLFVPWYDDCKWQHRRQMNVMDKKLSK